VVIEHEFLEQVAESSFDWSLSRAVEFIAQHKDPWPVLQALYRDKCVTFHHPGGDPVPHWRADEILRNRQARAADVIVKVTEAGITRANY
jgi:hypothetical protein